MIEYCRVYESGLDDFRAVILPNVWEQLILAGDLHAQGLILIGATDDEEPIAALVARTLENEEVYINSIYVTEDHRRMGIGTQMLQELLAEASDLYVRIYSEDFPLFLHTEYILPSEDFDQFTAFLKKQGFTDFLELSPTYLFEKADLAKAIASYTPSTSSIASYTPSTSSTAGYTPSTSSTAGYTPSTSSTAGYTPSTSGITSVAQLKDWNNQLAAEVFEDAAYHLDPAFCFVHRNFGNEEHPDEIVDGTGKTSKAGTEEKTRGGAEESTNGNANSTEPDFLNTEPDFLAGEPDFLAAALSAGESDFYLCTSSGIADPDPAACADTVMTLLQALCQAKEDFTLIVDGERNENLPSFAGSQHSEDPQSFAGSQHSEDPQSFAGSQHSEDPQSFAGSQHSEDLSLFADLVKIAGSLCRRQEAGMYVVLEE